ncbi:hypothetical protein CYMTET_20460, partial [Cymbomonas tetramitiformis]
MPQVVCDAPPPTNHEIDAGLHPVSASDPASFGSPFEEPLRVSFMDRVMPTCSNPSLKLCSIDSVHEPVRTGELSVIDDDDGSDGYSFSGDEIHSAPPATRSRVGVATLPRFFSFASLALPALMCLTCVSAVQGSVVLDRAPEFTAAVHPIGVTANSLSDLPYCFTFGISFPSEVSAGLNSDFQFSGFLILLYEFFPASGFWSWLLDYGPGFWFWTLASGLWFWIMTSGLWFWLDIFDADNFFNSGLSGSQTSLTSTFSDSMPFIPSRQQMTYATVLAGAGIFFLILAITVALPVVVIFPSKFALTFSLGTGLIMAAIIIVKGWKQQLKHMCSQQRLPFTLGYFGSLVMTLYAALFQHSYVNSLFFSGLQ